MNRLSPDRPKVPDVLPVARAYISKPGNEVGGNLHIVLADPNTDDASVRSCLEQCRATGDLDGERLALLLLAMSETGRKRVAGRVWGDETS